MVGNMRKRREDGLNVGAGAGNCARQEGQRSEGQRARDGQIDPVSVGSIISNRSEKRQKRAQNQFASRQFHVLVMDFLRNRLVAAGEELPESKELQLFCAFLAGAQYPQIVSSRRAGVCRTLSEYPRNANLVSARNSGTTHTISARRIQGEITQIPTASVTVLMTCWTNCPLS